MRIRKGSRSGRRVSRKPKMLMAIRDISAPDPGALQLFAVINQSCARNDVPLEGGRSGRWV
jgi:hypothetical protein